MATHDEWYSKYERERQERKAEAKNALLNLAEPLTAAGYRYLVGFFDGSGDDGCVQTIIACKADAEDDGAVTAARCEGDLTGDPVPESVAAGKLDTEVSDAIWRLAPDGFEINEGGFGAVILDAAEKKVKVNYSSRVEQSVADDYEV